MEDKEILNLIDESPGGLDINDDLKRNIYEYLLKVRKFKNNHNFIIRIPTESTQNFDINHIYHINQGHIEKTSSEIVTGVSGAAMSNAIINSISRKPATTKLEKRKSKDTELKELHEIRNEISELKKTIGSLKSSVKDLNKENHFVKEILYSNASSFNDLKKTQTIPIDIYLDTNEPQEIFEVYDSVLNFAKSIGFDESVEFEAVKGSWFKRMLVKSQEKLSSEEVMDRLKEAEYGIEVNTILKQQSEIDRNQSEALSNIITSLKDIPNAAIRIGALVVVKLTDEEGAVSLQTRTLSIKELHLLNKKPELLQMPKQILKALAKEISDVEPPQISEN